MTIDAVSARPAVQALESSLIRVVANAGMGRTDVLPFWFGESDQPTPQFIRDAAIAVAGSRARRSIRRTSGDHICARRSPSTSSGCMAPRSRRAGSPPWARASTALMLAAQTVISPGDRVVAVTPLWPNITEIPKILGAEVVRVPLAVANGKWSLDLDRLLAALTPGTRMVIINSPNNPTGWTIEDDEVDAVLAHCRKHGIWVLSDDAYERLVHDPARQVAPSFLAPLRAGRPDHFGQHASPRPGR